MAYELAPRRKLFFNVWRSVVTIVTLVSVLTKHPFNETVVTRRIYATYKPLPRSRAGVVCIATAWYVLSSKCSESGRFWTFHSHVPGVFDVGHSVRAFRLETSVKCSWVALPYYRSKVLSKILSEVPCNSFGHSCFDKRNTAAQHRTSATVVTLTAESGDHETQYTPCRTASNWCTQPFVTLIN